MSLLRRWSVLSFLKSLGSLNIPLISDVLELPWFLVKAFGLADLFSEDKI